jgi:hypothetical protein
MWGWGGGAGPIFQEIFRGAKGVGWGPYLNNICVYVWWGGAHIANISKCFCMWGGGGGGVGPIFQSLFCMGEERERATPQRKDRTYIYIYTNMT